MTSPSSELASALADGTVLLGISAPASLSTSLEALLKSRLSNYYSRLPVDKAQSLEESTEDLQLLTGREALSIVKRIHEALDFQGPESESLKEGSPPRAPAIGTRDLAEVRTLLSVVFKWAVRPLMLRLGELWPSSPQRGQGTSEIVDLTVDADVSQLLSSLITSLFSFIFPEGAQGRISQTLIATTLLSLYSPDILLPSISLGWLPESQVSDLVVPLHEARPLATRFLRLLTPAQAILALTNVISSTLPPPPVHARKACTHFLTKQLLRPHGIKGLFDAAFSSDEIVADDAKFEQIAKMLNSVPSSMKSEDYHQVIFPQVLAILTNDARPNYKRAAAFAIFRAIVPQVIRQNTSSAASVVQDILHRPLRDAPEQHSEQTLAAHDALWSLTVLISNTEPSPAFISRLLSPVIPDVYALLFDLGSHRLADPQVKESVTGVLLSWGKIIDRVEGTNTLWSVIEGGRDYTWKFGLEGNFWKLKSQEDSSPSIIMPGNISNLDNDIDDLDTNIFDLFPDPVHFVEFLKNIDRGDIASSLFIKLLEDYRDMKGQTNEDPVKTLHKLQIIMQMQKRLSEGTTSNILQKPDHLLSFIFHVLDAAGMTLQAGTDAGPPRRPRLPVEDTLEDADSDDEAPDSEVIGPDDELIETAITLLLSILEADETLTARVYPIFNDIFVKLEPLALKGSSALRPLAREARLVITARLANVSSSKRSGPRKQADEDDQEVYQKALKLLQDPILPVRAHGLLLLRELVSNSAVKGHKVNSALVPSILAIFLQAVQDEDSYMFLNAVQGLAALADAFGKEIIQGLVHDYAGGLVGLGAGNLTQQDLDIRLRIGEALGSIIQRRGTALGLYVDILVPPLFATARRSNIPTALRTSSLSLLAECVDTYPLAMLPYVEDLSQAMIDLLQIENIPLPQRKPESKEDPSTGGTIEQNATAKQSTPTLDSDPTLKNSKFPPLRRAAIHFLSLLIKAAMKLVYDGADINLAKIFPRVFVRRMSVTLGYVSSTDEDNMVRVMARETKESLEELQAAAFGL
ncbi:hypothetical protein HYPSUDRAFT_125960 [Hypholoma sublateritium FD-334 SS-4]|uniref:Uncharacterized protein n=1 Tax=Hypholoma sublateritium (strain FD-334 SS-4) TaxID=945553 RepID=A0A0D2QEM0_HYPSF|nr:hypothetical protein HYPSUDRAFT_125960 [Hypholoma sublateritium FD-334 SS-4]